MKNKTPIKWRAVFAESALIGASILLAFALQDWDEASDIEERTLIALCNVKSELDYNRILIKGDYIPRQKGLLAVTKASIAGLANYSDSAPPKTNLKQMLSQESLRYSAWDLAGESGYLLHANFQLATEIGALFDYQEGRYFSTIMRINDTVADYNTLSKESPIDYYTSLSDLVTEWSRQTDYLNRKYDALFERSDFIALECET